LPAFLLPSPFGRRENAPARASGPPFFGICGHFYKHHRMVFRQETLYLTVFQCQVGALASLYWVKQNPSAPAIGGRGCRGGSEN